jgi:uncharacterized protein (TIGR02996 family)
MQEADFLSVIAADPDCDATRLVYADWLEDCGQAHRAEFIRAQVALAHLDEHDPRRRPLESCERGLLSLYEREWVRPLGLGPGMAGFSRGLVEAVTLDADLFLARAERLFRHAPVRRVFFLDEGDLARLLASPWLARLTALDFDGPLGPAGAQALARCPHLAGLTSLGLNGIGAGERGARALAASPHAVDRPGAGRERPRRRLCRRPRGRPRLRRARLPVAGRQRPRRPGGRGAGLRPPDQPAGAAVLGQALGDEGARLLGASPSLTELRTLGLPSNGISAAGLAELVGPHRTALTSLTLSGNPVGDAGANILARCPTLPASACCGCSTAASAPPAPAAWPTPGIWPGCAS